MKIANKKIVVEINWDCDNPIDADCFLLIVGSDGKLLSNEHLLFYNNAKTPNQEAEHLINSEIADECFLIDFSKMDNNSKEIIFIYSMLKSYNNQIDYCTDIEYKIRFIDDNQEFIYGTIKSNSNVHQLFKFKNKNNEWNYEKVDIGNSSDIRDIIQNYINHEI